TAPPVADGECLAITHVTIIDVATGSAEADTTVLIRGERITAVGPSAVVAVLAGATVLDGRGKYLIPGLWDMHAHLIHQAFDGLLLRHGVTGVRHMFGVNPLFDPRTPRPNVDSPRPRLVAAHQILDGPDTAFGWPTSRNVVAADNAASARAGVREL